MSVLRLLEEIVDRKTSREEHSKGERSHKLLNGDRLKQQLLMKDGEKTLVISAHDRHGKKIDKYIYAALATCKIQRNGVLPRETGTLTLTRTKDVALFMEFLTF